MTYDIEITEVAEKRLRKFDRGLQRMFLKKVDKLRSAPKSYGKPLRSVMAGAWELYFERRYRILYSVDEKKKTVLIKSILHKDEF